MYNEPLTFEVVPGNTADTRIFRLHGPITLSNCSTFRRFSMPARRKSPSSTSRNRNTWILPGSASCSTTTSRANAGRFLRLVAVNYRVAELLKLTSAHTLIKTYDSVAAAEAATS
jgi:hypothetical protein